MTKPADPYRDDTRPAGRADDPRLAATRDDGAGPAHARFVPPHRDDTVPSLRADSMRDRLDGPKLAIALHDVEPASYRRCAAIREWLSDRGVDRVTLLVIPAPQLHPFTSRSPELAYWLLDRQDAGDAIAQHGLRHRQTRPARFGTRIVRHWQGGIAAEYAGMSAEATAESVEAGRRVLVDAGVTPRGFVAPAYAYTGALRGVLAERFDWWATLLGLHGNAPSRTPALCLGTSGPVKRSTSPLVVRAGARFSRDLLRLDLHPTDFDHPRHVEAVERVLQMARDRAAVTYDDLC